MASVSLEKNSDRRKRVLLGILPPDFLRITDTPKAQLEVEDQQAAWARHHQLVGSSLVENAVGFLNVTVAQAKLSKNYGLTKMDPYVRLRVGYCVYNTQADRRGGRTPHWDMIVKCPLPEGANSIYVEIYDECSFVMDELIAWAHISIGESVLNGETTEDWYPLNGKQGAGKEGMINLVLSYENRERRPFYPITPRRTISSTGRNMFDMQQRSPVPVYTQIPLTTSLSPSNFQIEEMFPNIEKDVLMSVIKVNRGNADDIINALLQMSSDA